MRDLTTAEVETLLTHASPQLGAAALIALHAGLRWQGGVRAPRLERPRPSPHEPGRYAADAAAAAARTRRRLSSTYRLVVFGSECPSSSCTANRSPVPS